MSIIKKRKFMKLYRPIHDRFERFCKARAYGEMEYQDLMQESIRIAFEKFNELKSPDAFLHFLFGISMRVMSNANKKRREDTWSDHLENACVTTNEAEAGLQVEDLYKALGQLVSDQREAIILFEISGFSIKEIAVMQGVSEDAIKKRLSRGRQELALLMSEESSYLKKEVS